MTNRRPLVIQDGLVSELFPGDQAIAGYSPTEIISGSGLGGGTSVSDDPAIYVQLAPDASGLIVSSGGLGTDGVALVNSSVAVASGYSSVIYADTALASGNAALFTATSALASGNAALALVPSLGVAEGTQALLTAAGTIEAGHAVGFDDTGKIQSIRRETTITEAPMVFGPRVTYEPGLMVGGATAVNTTKGTTDFIHVYNDAGNSYYVTAVVGNLVGSSGVYGTPVVIRSNNGGNNPGTTAIYSPEAQRYVITFNYFDGVSSYYYSTNTIAVSGLNLYPGTQLNLQTASNLFYYNSTVYDSLTQKVVYVYGNPSSSFALTAKLGTVTGNTITAGTAGSVADYIGNPFNATYINNSKTVSVHRGNSGYGTSYVITSSGTVPGFGPKTIFRSASVGHTDVAYDQYNDRLVASFNDVSTTKGVSVVGSISGVTTSYSASLETFAPSGASYISSVYDEAARKVVVSAYDTGHASTTAYVGTVSGDTISFATPYSLYGSGLNYYNYVAYSRNANRLIFTQRDATLSNYGVSYVSDPIYDFTYNPTLGGFPNFIGAARSSATSGTSCLVDMTGSVVPIATNNLVPSTYYYLDPVTSGFTTDSQEPISFSAAVPWTYLGKAVSTSGLYLLKSL